MGIHMNEILQYLKANGEKLDAEIAAAVGLSLAKVHACLAELFARGDIVACHSIRFQGGREIAGILCRISGSTPQASPGRKAKPL